MIGIAGDKYGTVYSLLYGLTQSRCLKVTNLHYQLEMNSPMILQIN